MPAPETAPRSSARKLPLPYMSPNGSFIAIAPLGVGTALSLMGDSTLYTVLPTHFDQAGIALAHVGIILSANRFIRLATNGPAGWLYDRVRDRRAIFLGSLVIGAVSTALYAVTADLVPFLLARLLWGVAWSGIWIGGNALVLEMAPERARGHWVGIYQVWFFFGSALGALCGGLLTDMFGYRPTLWIGALISAGGALLAALGLYRHTRLRPQDAGHEQRLPKLEFALVSDLRAISPAMWTAIAAHGVNRLVVAGVVMSTLGLVIQSLRADIVFGVATTTGGLLAGRTFVSLASAPLFGGWSDRIGSRWGLLVASLFLGALGMVVFSVSDLVAVIVGALFGAIASGSIQSLATALIGDLSAARQQGRHLGVFHTAGDLGSAIGPIAAFALFPITGLSAVFVGCAVLMGLNALWAQAVGKRARVPAVL